MDSPPKRMTRARAAAKSGEPSVKTTRIVTAAAKARTTISSSLTASTKSTAAKRKTRADDHDEEEARRPKGRPRKSPENEEETPVPAPAPAAAAPPPPPARATRARVITSKTAAGTVKRDIAPAKPLRGRPKKTAPSPEEEEKKKEDAPELAKKTVRGRAATATKPITTTTTAIATTAAKPAVKKIVKFQEPDKENVEPSSKPKEPPAPGIRGRPARRGGATAARSSRAATKTPTSETGEKKPLSPRKVTQIPVSRDDSEDELAMEKVSSIKPMMKSPIKPPAKKPEPMPVEVEAEATITVNTAIFNPPENNTTVFASPARRPPSPLRDTMKSPAKRIPGPLPGSALKLTSNDQTGQTPFKTNLLQSAAKRPQSPIKGLGLASTQMPQVTESAAKPSMLQSPAKRAMPGFKPLLEARQADLVVLGESPRMKPLVVSTPTPTNSARPSEKLMLEDDMQENEDDDVFKGPIEGPQFSGRMSAVLPRFADPSLKAMAAVDEEDLEDEEALQLVDDAPEVEGLEEEQQAEDEDGVAEDQQVEEPVDPAEENEDVMALDEIVAEMEESTELPPKITTLPENPVFQLRQKDLDPCHDLHSTSDSEDDTLPIERISATPSAHKTPKSRMNRSVSKQSRRSTIGFTALADQLGSWSAASPIKASSANTVQPTLASKKNGEDSEAENTPMRNSFFEDEMLVHSEPTATAQTPCTEPAEVQVPGLDDDLMVTNEDMALAQEANEMSLMESREAEDNHRQSFDDSLSDASQEYGDENQIPDPVTPARPMMKSFHTTTKVPLKPADDSSTSPLKKRSFSASRVAPKRPSGPSRSATVISYSPSKERRRSSRNAGRGEAGAGAAPTTPGKTEMWSTMGTPARTPHKNLDPGLLRGAIVFVDVHTSEGADASGVFIELLTQMGARCVKSWSWNPSSPTNSEGSKVGITHVVFKDGGKRTLEKVREANGVVQCVGVSWVLDCERENEWLDESPYCIDTTCVPRGGARRRKSMEPKALANMNGTLVSSPSKERRESAAAPSTPNRRQSSIWIHTPSEMGGDKEEEEEDMEWSKLILTPVPKTPAPETLARFAAETPSDIDDDEEEDDTMSPTKVDMLTRTCPPKAQKFVELGAGILSKDKDEQVLMRLMAARRKSLQFAPKIGSPLARMWH